MVLPSLYSHALENLKTCCGASLFFFFQMISGSADLTIFVHSCCFFPPQTTENRFMSAVREASTDAQTLSRGDKKCSSTQCSCRVVNVFLPLSKGKKMRKHLAGSPCLVARFKGDLCFCVVSRACFRGL